MCYTLQTTANGQEPSRATLLPSGEKTAAPTLSDAEKSKMLQEVEAQQADFGIQK
jgi:hypothetical protein